MGDKIVTIVMSIVLTLIIFFGIPLIILFLSVTNDKAVDLSNIDNTTREEIVELMNLSNMSNDIELVKAQMPTVYRDVYYEIYFSLNNNEDNKVNNMLGAKNDSDGYGRDLTNVEDNEYSCTIYRLDDSSIDLLENLFKDNEN